MCALCSVNGILDACESVEETKKVCRVNLNGECICKGVLGCVTLFWGAPDQIVVDDKATTDVATVRDSDVVNARKT